MIKYFDGLLKLFNIDIQLTKCLTILNRKLLNNKIPLNLFLFSFIFLVIFISCKKNSNQEDSPAPISAVASDSLSVQQDSILEAATINNPPFNSLIGADGGILKDWIDSVIPYFNDTLLNVRIQNSQTLTTAQQRVYLINKILSTAYELADKKNMYDTAAGLHKPAQWGIAYGRGLKFRDYKERKSPTGGNSIHIQDMVKGLDCGGFIQTIFKYAGVDIADFQASEFPQKLAPALASSEYSSLTLINKGYITNSSLILEGDIVIWPQHIGIISRYMVTPPQALMFYSSHGTGWPSDPTEQQKNQGKKRGVHPVDWITATTNTQYWSTPYTIYRLQ